MLGEAKVELTGEPVLQSVSKIYVSPKFLRRKLITGKEGLLPRTMLHRRASPIPPEYPRPTK
jgi:hypothetical protein